MIPNALSAMSKHVLIVEGPGDTEFLTVLTSKFGKSLEIQPPKSQGATGNGIGNVVKTLPIVLSLAATGAIGSLGAVVDADYFGINGGFADRRAEIAEILRKFGYDVPVLPPSAANIGEIFTHPNGLAPFGLWIMPNHRDDGSLEDFLLPLITDPLQQQALAHAVTSLGARAPEIQFYNPTCHKSKAEVASWLALQKPPGMANGIALKNALFNSALPAVLAFQKWIDTVYP
jgi:hypothetical protein